MNKPEANIDPAILTTFQEERQWLRSYSTQLTNFSTNFQSTDKQVPETLHTVPLSRNFEKKDLLIENEKLKEELKIKQEKIEALMLKIINDEVYQESWKKSIENEIEFHRKKIEESVLHSKEVEAKNAELLAEISQIKPNEEISKLGVKLDLVLSENKRLEDEVKEREKTIEELKNRSLVLEEEKLKALDLFTTKEQKIKEQIETTYDYIELQQKIEYYSKKMKEYQTMYLEVKSYEDKMLKVLKRNKELESCSEEQRRTITEISAAYSQLKQDYEFLSVKLRAVSEQNIRNSEILNKSLNEVESLSIAKDILQKQLGDLISEKRDTVLSYSSVEDLIIKNTEISIKLHLGQQRVQQLEGLVAELKRRLHTFENPKELPTVIQEELSIETDYSATREEYIKNLSLKNARVLAENEYLAEKNRLSEVRLLNLFIENQQLETSIRLLQEKFETLQTVDFSQLNNERFERDIKVLETKLQVNEEVLEKTTQKNRKIKEELEGLNEYCKELESKINEGFWEMKKRDDQVEKNEGIDAEKCELLKTCAGLEERIKEMEKEFRTQVDRIGKRNKELEESARGNERAMADREVENWKAVERAKSEMQRECDRKIEEMKEGLLRNMEKLTYLVYKSLYRPNEVEDARGAI